MREEEDDFIFESTSHILPADSSLAELIDLVKVKSLQQVTILDLSYNPVKNISSIVRMNTELSGPRSKTLHYMNWYPSGKLCFLPLPSTCVSDDDFEKGDEIMLQRFLKWQSRNVVHEEDFAYNDPTIQKQNNVTAINEEGVQWTGVGAENHQALKPSEIFSAVSSRAENDIDDQQHGQQSKPPAKKKRSEKERTERLDRYIQNLTRTSKDGKKKRVSDKVRSMLIKSRAEGNKKLRMEDRFHLELFCLMDADDNALASTAATSTDSAASTYKFFSRATTAGKVASSVSGPIGKDMSAEFLVSVNNNYRRLPNTMSLHDAQQAGWLHDFDFVIIRTFSLGRDDEFCQSRSVLDPDSDAENEMDLMELGSNTASNSAGTSSTETLCNPIVDQTDLLQQRLHMIYTTPSFEKLSKKKKQPSKQVQRMLMKSKSVGDKGIKPDDRVHLETIIYNDDGSEDINGACSSSYRFFSKRSTIEQLSSTFQDKNAQIVEILAPQPSESSSLGCVYQQISPTNLTVDTAVKKGLLEDFGRIIVRLTSE